MSSLQQVMQQVPALRDRLDVAALNAVSQTCQELNASVRASDTYRERYVADHYVAQPLGAAAPTPAFVYAHGVDFKKIAYGQQVFARRLAGTIAPTPADLEAERYYYVVVRSGSGRTLDEQRQHMGLARPPDPAPMDPARKCRIVRQCAVTAGVLVGAGVSLALFFYGTTLAAIVVLGALCAAFTAWARP